MKTKLSLFAIVSACYLVLTGCEQNNYYEDPQETITVGFNSNLIDVSESPMDTRAFSNRDIFAVEVHDENGYYYSSWLTSNLGSDKIRLLKGKRYICYLVYMPNGQDIVWQNSDGTFDRPFCAMGAMNSPRINEGVFYGDYSVEFCNFGGVRKKDVTSPPRNGDYNLSDVEIYYGVTELFSNEDINITVDLYRMMFGIKVVVTNFNKGKLYFGSSPAPSSAYPSAYVYKMTPDNPVLDKVFEIPYMPFNDLCHTPSDVPSKEKMINWSAQSRFSIVYVDPDGAEFTVMEKDLEVKRMTRYTISFDLEAIISEYNGTISANIVDDSWSDASVQ